MEPGVVIADRFVVEGHVDEGGMGAIWRAHDRLSGTKVAIKRLLVSHHATAEARFFREASVLAELKHPGIVRYVAHGRTPDGALYLAMQWLEGVDLHKRLHDEPPTLQETLGLVRTVADALSYAHARGVTHRDLKPGNIFLVEGDFAQAKVLDFGLARRATTRMLTEVGGPVGTPGYMAPEQARGEGQVGPAADVFALGCVMFECIAGRAPFVAQDLMSLLAKILLEEAPPLGQLRPDVPRGVEALVHRMLQKDPARRPSDAGEIVRALDLLGDLHGAAPPSLHTRGKEALTGGEQRLLSVVVVGGVPVDEDGPTMSETGDARWDAVAAQTEAFGAQAERLLDGSIVVVSTRGGNAIDRAAQAARCALALRAIDPDAPMALATGRATFAGRWPVGEVIDRAAAVLAAPARQHTTEIDERYGRPIRLDELTAGLLDVGFDVGGDAAGLVLRGERTLIESARTLLGVVTPCVGRDRELGILEDVLKESIEEPVSRAVFVVGEAGVGKSRLRHELVRRAREQHAELEVLTGRGDPISAGSPFGLIAPALRRAAGILDGEPLDVRRRKLRARVGRHVEQRDRARVVEFLGELVGVPVGDDEASVQLRAARRDPMLMGDQMRRAFEDFLAAECAERPVLFVLEDLHHGDLPSVQFVDAALRHCANAKLMIVALARPEAKDLFPDIWRGRSLTEIHLGPLGKRAAEKLVKSVLGEHAEATAISAIVERADGNALFLEELIRFAATSGGGIDVVPETLRAMVQARLEALDPDQRRILRAASVFGRRFWRGAVLSLVGDEGRTPASIERARSWIDELVAQELVTRRGEGRFPGEDELMFRHALVRDAAYAMLTDSDRTLGHRLAAEWLERAGEADAMVLAEHYERGGDRTRALERYLRAADHALEANDLRGAVERAERGAACGARGTSLGILRWVQAQAFLFRGENENGETAAREALTLLRAGSGPWWGALGDAIVANGRLARMDAVVDLADLGRRTRPDPDAVPMSGTSLARAAIELINTGKAALADALLLVVAPVADDPSVAARVAHARASKALFDGDTALALRALQTAAAAFEDGGDLRHACLELANVGFVLLELGDAKGAQKALRESLAGAQRMGLLTVVAGAQGNLALALARLGDPEAIPAGRGAAELARAQGNRRTEAANRIYTAMALARLDVRAAEEEARKAVSIAEVVLPVQAYAQAFLAELLLARGEIDEARFTIEAAMRTLVSLGGLEAGEALVRRVHAEILDAMGDREGARREIGAARERLMQRAAKIGDAEMRENFLRRVPDNAATLELADRWKASSR